MQVTWHAFFGLSSTQSTMNVLWNLINLGIFKNKKHLKMGSKSSTTFLIIWLLWLTCAKLDEENVMRKQSSANRPLQFAPFSSIEFPFLCVVKDSRSTGWGHVEFRYVNCRLSLVLSHSWSPPSFNSSRQLEEKFFLLLIIPRSRSYNRL